MGHGRVHRHHQVQIHHYRCQIRKGSGIEPVAKVRDGKRDCWQLFCPRPHLQAQHVDFLPSSQRFKMRQGNRAKTIGFMFRASLPHDADFEALQGRQFFAPVFHQAAVRPQIGDSGWNICQGRAENARQAK